MSNSIHIQNPINNKVLYEIDEITDIQATSIFETAKKTQSVIQNMSVKARIEEVFKIRDFSMPVCFINHFDPKRGILKDLLSFKYDIYKNESKEVQLTKRSDFFPFGISYDSYMSESEFLKINEKLYDSILVDTVVISDDDVEKISKILPHHSGKFTNYYLDKEKYFEARSIRVLEKVEFKQNTSNMLSFQINNTKPKIVFLQIPYDSLWSAEVNGKRSSIFKVNFGFIGLLVEKNNSKISLKYIF